MAGLVRTILVVNEIRCKGEGRIGKFSKDYISCKYTSSGPGD